MHRDSIAKVRGREGELREDVPEAKRNFPECKSGQWLAKTAEELSKTPTSILRYMELLGRYEIATSKDEHRQKC